MGVPLRVYVLPETDPEMPAGKDPEITENPVAFVADTELFPELLVAYETPTLKSLERLVSLHVGGTRGAM